MIANKKFSTVLPPRGNLSRISTVCRPRLRDRT